MSAMLPHNGHQFRSQHQQQQSGLPSFMSPNPAFEPSPYFNLDPSQAAKQMAALSAASQARIASGRSGVPASNLSASGINLGPYPEGNTPANHLTGALDPLSNSSNSVGGLSNFQMPHNHTASSAPNLTTNASFLDPSIPQSFSTAHNSAQGINPLKQRQQGFLVGLSNIMAKRNTPLPPALTGIASPNYDPSNSPWKIIEPSPTEIGSFRLAGKDVNLFKLWGIVFQAGGGASLNNSNGWTEVLSQFELPEQFPQPQANGSTSVALTLSQYYMAILHPLEEMYKRNLHEHQRKAQLASRQLGAQGHPTMLSQGRPPQGGSNGSQPTFSGQLQRGAMTNTMSLANQPIAGVHASGVAVNGSTQYPQPPQTQALPQQPLSSALSSQQPNDAILQDLSAPLQPESAAAANQPNVQLSEQNVLEQDIQGIKRKLDLEDDEGKRTRQKIESEPPEPSPTATSGADRSSIGPPTLSSSSQLSTATPVPPRPRQQPSRRRIEYVPLAREVESFGGRDLKLIENEVVNLPQRRPLRDINDWGTVDIEALTMSIRSGLSTELSYALATFTLLSTMRGQTPGSGFPIFHCADLLDEVLDLLEDQAFDGADDSSPIDSPDDVPYIITNRELVNTIHEIESQPFAGLERRQGSKDPDLGPRQRPANIVLAVTNIIRNLSIIQDNGDFISRHHRLLDVMLRVCMVARVKDGPPCAASSILSLGDLVTVRRDTLFTLANIAGSIQFSASSAPEETVLKMAGRAFQLIASYLVDPTEAVSPWAYMQLSGAPLSGHPKPPSLPDISLEVFTKLSQADSNRKVFARAVAQASIWRLFVSLVHRLPVVDADFQLVTRELWLSYLEKNIMAIYSLAFLSSPELKKKIKTNRSLGFTTVMLRMIQKFLINSNQEGRMWFLVSARRAIEAMKVVDDGEDSFETPKSTLPTMAFGMGWGEIGEKGTEKGTGLLGGHRDVAWDMMMQVHVDGVMFGELESLARVE